MRILHLTTEFPPVIYGGLGTAVGGWVTASARAGISVAVQLVEGPLVLDANVAQAPLMVTDMAMARTAEAVRVRPSRRDLVVRRRCHSSSRPGRMRSSAEFAPSRSGVPMSCISTRRCCGMWPKRSRLRPQHLLFTMCTRSTGPNIDIGNEPNPWLAHSHAQDQAIAASDRLIALTRSESELLGQYYPEMRAKIRVVGNGIDDSEAARAAAFRPHRTGSPVVLYSGRLVERKGIRELLDAIPHVLDAVPNASLCAGGRAPAAERRRGRGAVAHARGTRHIAIGSILPAGYRRKTCIAGIPLPTYSSCRAATSPSEWSCWKECCTDCRSLPPRWADRPTFLSMGGRGCFSRLATGPPWRLRCDSWSRMTKTDDEWATLRLARCGINGCGSDWFRTCSTSTGSSSQTPRACRVGKVRRHKRTTRLVPGKHNRPTQHNRGSGPAATTPPSPPRCCSPKPMPALPVLPRSSRRSFPCNWIRGSMGDRLRSCAWPLRFRHSGHGGSLDRREPEGRLTSAPKKLKYLPDTGEETDTWLPRT